MNETHMSNDYALLAGFCIVGEHIGAQSLYANGLA